MPTLRSIILEHLVRALKEGRKKDVETLRFLMAQVKNREIEVKKREEGLSDEEMLEVILREAKKRKESIAEFEKGGRQDLVEKEKGELEILQRYLPEQLSEEEIRREVEKVIQEIGAQSIKDLGEAMGVLMLKLKGKADGAVVNKLVRESLEN